MALPNVIFNQIPGLNTPLPGEDHVSGMLFFRDNANLPSGFSTTSRVEQLFSIEQAEKQGITQTGTHTAVMWYHINEFFRIAPSGELWVMIGDSAAISATFSELRTLQLYSSGRIKQVGILMDYGTTVITADLQKVHNMCEDLAEEHVPMVAICTPDITGEALGDLPDLKPLDNHYVAVDIGEDMLGAGGALGTSTGKSVGTLGAILGSLAKNPVHESIAYVKNNELTQGGSEYAAPTLGNGTVISLEPVADQNALHDKGYIFMRRFSGLNGTYFNGSSTAAAADDDYNTLERNRVVNKARRLVYANLIQELNGPVYLQANGQLSNAAVGFFKATAEKGLQQMFADGEISSFEVQIDPAQNILSTNNLNVTIKIVPVGKASTITVNISLVTSLQ